MTQPGFEEELACGAIAECRPTSDGKLTLRIKADGEPVESGDWSRSVLTAASYRGQFLNGAEEALAPTEIDENRARAELETWLADLAEIRREEAEKFLRPQVKAVIDGSQAVKIHGGETTTIYVTLEWEGETRELEFTADEMTGGGGALVSQMANKFFEFGFEIGSEEWETVVDDWQEDADVVGVVDETGEDVLADRVAEKLTHAVTPTTDKELLANGPESAWLDLASDANAPGAEEGDPVVWVEKPFLVDQLESAGKSLDHLGQLVKSLNRRGDLYGVPKDGRRRWPNSQGRERAKFYPFRPPALAIDVEEFDGDDEGDVSEEVAP